MKSINCEFVGSFVRLEQLPHDLRPQIAFAGRSNVGKSSLLNKLVGQRKLAKVSATPGKTRALNFYLVNDRFYFVDLPGYGYAKAAQSERKSWGKLIESYLEKSERLIGLIVLLDCRREPGEEDIQLFDWLSQKQLPGMVVITKIDKINRDKVKRKTQEIEQNFDLPAIPFSIVSGVGKQELLSAILGLVSEEKTRLYN